MKRLPILPVFLVFDCTFNRRHYAAMIGRAFLHPPMFARVRIV